MAPRTAEFTPPIDCDRLEMPAFNSPYPGRYDFRAMLADFTEYKGQAPKSDSKRLLNGYLRNKKSNRSPFRNNYWDKPPNLSNTSRLASPPASPKRRKTEASLDNYTGDQYEHDFGRLDLCAQIRMLRTVDDTSDEEALTWSSSDDNEEEPVGRLFHLRH